MTLIESSIYQEALKRVRFRLEEASRRQVEVFGSPWYLKHFAYGSTPHMLKDFKTILGKMHLTIAASTIDSRSAEPLRMNQGFESIAQSMFTHAHAYKLEADELREMILLLKGNEMAPEAAIEYVTNKLWNFVSEAVKGVHARLDIITQTALSNKGVFTFTAQNDPQSPFINQSISFGLPAANISYAASGYTWVDANLATVDPVKDIDDIVKASPVSLEKILTDKATVNFVCKTAAMKSYINSTLYPNKPLTLTMLNNWLSENGYPQFEIVESKVMVQDGNKLSQITPWAAGQLVFIPKNQIGTIETQLSDAEMGMKDKNIDYSYYGRIEVRRYTQGESQNANYAEITKASLTAAPSMDTIADIMVFDSNHTA